MATSDITIKLALEGGQELKTGIRDAGLSMRNLGSELKKLSSEMALSKNKQDLMKQSVQNLGKQFQTQKGNVKLINQQFTEAKEKADALEREYRELAETQGENSKETEKAREKWLEASRNVDRYSQKLNQAETKLNQVELELRQTQQELIKTNIQESKFGRINSTLSGVQPRLNAVANGFMKITKAITGVAMGLVGLSLTKAFAKLETLEEVRATFKGLGKDTKEIQRLMDAVSNSVTGTKYGMADMAKVSKGADASIGNYSMSMEDYLSRIADISAFTGQSVTQTGTMFNKAMAKNKVDARLMNQLIQAGIPIYDDLARVTGKSTAEISEMVTAGQIGFEDLYKATARYKDLATELGMSTLKGAGTILAQTWGNVGVAFLEGAYEPMRKGLTNIVLWLKSNIDQIKQWGASFGSALNYLINYVKTGEKNMKGLDSVAKKIAGTLRPFVTIVSALVKAFMNLSTHGKVALLMIATFTAPVLKLASGMITLSNNIQKCYTSFMKHAGAVTFDAEATEVSNKEIRKAYIEKQKETLANIKSTVAKGINTVATTSLTIATKIGTTAQRVMNRVMMMNPYVLVAGAVLTLVSALGIFLGTNEDARKKVGDFFTNFTKKALEIAKNFPKIMESITTALSETLPEMVDAGSKMIVSIVEGFMNNLPKLVEMGTELIIKLIEGFTTALPQMIAGITQMISQFVSLIAKNLPLIIGAGLKILMALMQGIISALPMLIQSALQLVMALISGIVQMLPTILATGVKLLMAIIKGIIQTIPVLIASIPRIISAIIKALIQLSGQLISAGAKLLKNIWSGFRSWTGSFISNIAGFFRSIPNRIKSWLGSLVSVGSDWIKGLWQGISNAKDWVWNKIKSIISGFKDRVKKFFKIKSPSRVMADEVGKYLAMGIGVGFEEGMKSVGIEMQSALDSAMLSTDGVLATASGSFLADFDYDELAQAMSNQGIYLDGRLIGRAINNNDGVVAI